MSDWMQRATTVASEVYRAFLQQVVEEHVLNEREGAISEARRKQVNNGTHIDPRVIRLMAISGKGGWSPDPAKRERFARSTNVTLLDHLLSVMRGALLLAALDWLGRNPAMERQTLNRRLRVIALLAFLHDLDKFLGLERDIPLPSDEVESAMARYGLQTFLGDDVALSAEQVRYLIERVEASQTLRSPPQVLPPREFEVLTGYVALADKLDSQWLSSEPGKGGLAGVLQRLRDDQTLHLDTLRQWRSLELFDPHHPFLLDDFQRWLSFYSVRQAGVPPLIEVHQDGRLFLLLPAEHFETIIDEAIRKLCSQLPFNLELNVSNRGVPSLYNGHPDHGTLAEFVGVLSDRDLGALFRVKAELAGTLTRPLDEHLDHLGLAPRWPKGAGATLTPYPAASVLDEDARGLLHQAAHLTLLLNLKADDGKKAGLPDYGQREQAMLVMVDRERPGWLAEIGDDASRRTMTALWVTGLAAQDEQLQKAVWGSDGLLQRWLEGDGDSPGFNRFITGQGARITVAVERHFRQLLGSERVVPPDEQSEGRCLFTDEPVPFEDTINEALGLYGVNVSAFSGRDNRPETLASERAHTNVGPVSIAEYKLRALSSGSHTPGREPLPVLVSSPSTTGLFGGLGLSSDRSMTTLSLYELSRQEVKKGNVYRGLESYQGRYRIARFESMSEKTGKQINYLQLLLQACRRVGRPVHVFRGLPTLQRAFFYYDAMPRILADLVGGNGLRLEQLPEALSQLHWAEILLETHGLGYDVLRLYATPASRFSAVCLAWCHLRDRDGEHRTISRLQHIYLEYLESKLVSNDEGALIKLGRAAAGIQKAVGAMASASDEMLVFNLCLETTNAVRAIAQDDEQSLILAIAGELETNLTRKGKAAARKHREGKSLREGCMDVAELFVGEVWHGVLKRHPPTQRSRRILGSIYRMAFLQATRHRGEEAKDETDD